ncbi:MAG: hypothetical protein AAFZ58_15495, partial [Pseudomonadota bacterium]
MFPLGVLTDLLSAADDFADTDVFQGFSTDQTQILPPDVAAKMWQEQLASAHQGGNGLPLDGKPLPPTNPSAEIQAPLGSSAETPAPLAAPGEDHGRQPVQPLPSPATALSAAQPAASASADVRQPLSTDTLPSPRRDERPATVPGPIAPAAVPPRTTLPATLPREASSSAPLPLPAKGAATLPVTTPIDFGVA